MSDIVIRLAYCAECKLLSNVPYYETKDPDYDPPLQDWIDRHAHGRDRNVPLRWSDEAHRGMQVFSYDVTSSFGNVVNDDMRKEMLMKMTDDWITHVKGRLAADQVEVRAYRDELRVDATTCFRKHGNPSFPGSACIDYHIDSKRIGRKNDNPKLQQYLCTYCPYESSLTVEKRWRRGDYNQS